jgi:isocitrate dehydrogenase
MDAQKIIIDEHGQWQVPDFPIIPFIEGDGIGPDIWRATKRVLDSAVRHTYQGKKGIAWRELFVGDKGLREKGERLPESALEEMKTYCVSLKGPLTTPVGEGIRSLNVTIRQRLDLYACIRPVKYFESVPSPMKSPEKIDMVVFRENTEDVYAGIEWEAGSPEAQKVIRFLETEMRADIPPHAGVGIKPVSEKGTKRLVERAIVYARDNGLPSVTLMHKGNIMKFTEGAFQKWGYQVAAEKFKDDVITEQRLYDEFGGERPQGKIVIKDRIADMLFQQVLLRPEEYSVIATPNLNGDYLSDALAAQVGGLGMAPGGNVGDDCAVFEATHGSAPKYAGLDKVNPSSLILSGVMMLDHIGWKEAAAKIREALPAAIKRRRVTYDLARQIEGAEAVKCSQFAEEVVKCLDR